MRVFTFLGVAVCLVLAIALVFWMSGLGAGTVVNPDGKVVDSERNAEGEYKANPFSKPLIGPFPKLEVSEKEFDFGLMKYPLIDRDGDKEPDGDSHKFIIKNAGEGVLKLARGPSTCQCTMSDLKDMVEVPPGGSTELTVTWKPDFPNDDFSKAATVWTNDPASFDEGSESSDGKAMFTVKGKVVQAVEVETETLSLGTLAEDKPTQFETGVFSRIEPQLEVSLKSASSPFITVEIVPMDAAKLEEKKALAGWKIRGTMEPKLPLGRIRETVVVSTNDETKPEITLTIEGQRQGPINIAGRFWDSSYTMIDFRRFAADKGISTTLSLYAGKQEQPLELQLVEVKPEGLVVTAERDAAYADPDRERWLVHVQVPAGRPPERLVGKEAGVVRLSTNLAEMPEVKFHIVYESR
jgi:hypothetical protein